MWFQSKGWAILSWLLICENHLGFKIGLHFECPSHYFLGSNVLPCKGIWGLNFNGFSDNITFCCSHWLRFIFLNQASMVSFCCNNSSCKALTTFDVFFKTTKSLLFNPFGPFEWGFSLPTFFLPFFFTSTPPSIALVANSKSYFDTNWDAPLFVHHAPMTTCFAHLFTPNL